MGNTPKQPKSAPVLARMEKMRADMRAATSEQHARVKEVCQSLALHHGLMVGEAVESGATLLGTLLNMTVTMVSLEAPKPVVSAQAEQGQAVHKAIFSRMLAMAVATHGKDKGQTCKQQEEAGAAIIKTAAQLFDAEVTLAEKLAQIAAEAKADLIRLNQEGGE